MIQGHGGNIYAMAQQMRCRPEEIVDMSSNINPLGMPPGLQDHLREHLHRISALPEPDAGSAIHHMGSLLDVDAGCILAGNGTTQFIYSACQALGSQNVLIVGPTYADYADACRMHHVPVQYFLAQADVAFEVNLGLLDKTIDGYDTVFICNPNNPTGRCITRDQLHGLCKEHPRAHFIIDESYLPFASDGSTRSMVSDQPDNVSVLWSLSKIFGVPGLRAGFLIANRATVSRFARLMQPWSLNALAQSAVDFLGNRLPAVHDFIAKTRRFVESERRKCHEAIVSRSRLVLCPSQASYLLIELPQGLNAAGVCRRMAERRILIRNCQNFHGLSDRYIRVALKDASANQLAVECLVEIVESASGSESWE